MQEEIWKDVPGYEGYYQVSNFGRARSLNRVLEQSNCTRLMKGKILSPGSDSYGYKTVSLHRNRKCKTNRIHSLVYKSFVNQNIKKGLVIDHINNNHLDNRVENLQLITHRQNISKSNINNKIKTSSYRNVTYRKDRGKWVVRFQINGKLKSFGSYNTEYSAHLVAKDIREELFKH